MGKLVCLDLWFSSFFFFFQGLQSLVQMEFH